MREKSKFHTTNRWVFDPKLNQSYPKIEKRALSHVVLFCSITSKLKEYVTSELPYLIQSTDEVAQQAIQKYLLWQNTEQSSYSTQSPLSKKITVKINDTEHRNNDGTERQELLKHLSCNEVVKVIEDRHNLKHDKALKVMSRLGCIGFIPRELADQFYYNRLECVSATIFSMTSTSSNQIRCLIELTLSEKTSNAEAIKTLDSSQTYKPQQNRSPSYADKDEYDFVDQSESYSEHNTMMDSNLSDFSAELGHDGDDF
ncbi:hypothetical protein [Vibrio comitans]|nr:hypothetical protein [Vibrio comitans]